MSCASQINDFVCRLKNFKSYSLHPCVVRASKLTKSCLEILQKHGFILSYSEGDIKYSYKVVINYDFRNKNPFFNAESITKPCRKSFCSVEKIINMTKKDKNRFGVVSTSNGIMNVAEAIERKVGGEVLFFV